ncbi:MAG TPA: alpha/beta fold hydrolase [Nevskiaceae bacterium]|nr:alpha/beta fold hydrolase [Nevskiaceae bacterium]
MKLLLRALRFAAVMAITGFLVAAAVLWFAQRSMIFPRIDARGQQARPADAQQVWLDIPGGRVEAWYLPPAEPHDARAPLIIFAHGNGEFIDRWPPAFDEPRRWGVGALLVEFPGYGRSTGAPSQDTVTAAMLAAWSWAAAQPGIDAQRIVAYGRSLGGGAVCTLATQRAPAALILESTFTSVRIFAARYFMPGFTVRDPFDNLACVQNWRGPLLVLHGDHDTLIPQAEGRALAAAAPQSEFVSLDCGHNDCPRSWPRIREFLAAHGVLH